jgi:hypothetical protein
MSTLMRLSIVYMYVPDLITVLVDMCRDPSN